MKALFILLLTFSAAVAKADLNDEFTNFIVTYSEQSHLYGEHEVKLEKFSPAQKAQFLKLATDEADIWVDTILEGDYALANDPLTIDMVTALYQGQKLVAYQIVYSQRAFDTSSCEYDSEAVDSGSANLDEVFSQCTQGRIYGTSFVSPNLQVVERDINNIEYFEAQ